MSALSNFCEDWLRFKHKNLSLNQNFEFGIKCEEKLDFGGSER